MSRLYGSGASAVGVGPFLTAIFGFVCMRENRDGQENGLLYHFVPLCSSEGSRKGGP